MRIAVDEDADGGCQCHRQVVTQPIVADAFRPPAGWQHVDSHRGVCHGKGTKGSAMKCPDNHEQQQCGCSQIAGKEDCKSAETDHQHRLSRKGVDDIAAEGTEQQGRDGIARQHEPYHVLRRPEVLAQIERQQRCQHVEGEKQREIRRHHLAIVSIPKSFHLLLFLYQFVLLTCAHTTAFERELAVVQCVTHRRVAGLRVERRIAVAEYLLHLIDAEPTGILRGLRLAEGGGNHLFEGVELLIGLVLLDQHLNLVIL